MKILSTDSFLLDELFNDLEQEHIVVEKESQIVDGGMSATGITTAISLGSLTLKTIDTLLKVLNFFQAQKNYYIHLKLKDGREIKLNDLSKEKQVEEFNAIKDNINVIFLEKGQK
jgi:hypothetical protein